MFSTFTTNLQKTLPSVFVAKNLCTNIVMPLGDLFRSVISGFLRILPQLLSWVSPDESLHPRQPHLLAARGAPPTFQGSVLPQVDPDLAYFPPGISWGDSFLQIIPAPLQVSGPNHAPWLCLFWAAVSDLHPHLWQLGMLNKTLFTL